ncbi:MAG TPA: hypothetical protein VF494_00985 [Candidatus Limnocylindrales bacterium]
MSPITPSPADIEAAFGRARQLQVELARKERAVGRKVQVLARALAALMEPGESFHRIGVGLHAFDVDGTTCLAAAYLEEIGEDYRYRYAVLCGGEAARRALTSAALDPGDSDEPGPGRRCALATYADYEDFLYRLPKYLGDVSRRAEDRLAAADRAHVRVQESRAKVAAIRRARKPPPGRSSGSGRGLPDRT